MSNRVDVSLSDGILHLRILAAELRDSQLVYEIRDKLVAAYVDSDATNVVVDFEDVNMVGSVGLLALLALRRHVTLRSGRIILCTLGEHAHEVMEVAGLINEQKPGTPTLFETASSVETAIKSLKS